MFVMTLADAYPEFVRTQEPLGPFTLLRVGGKAEFLAQPRSLAELTALMKAAAEKRLPVRVLGVGSNVLVRDEGVSGVVLRLCEAAFTRIEVAGRKVRVGGGAPLSKLISEATQHNLAGLETLVGISATVGGALRCNAGDRTGEIGEYVRRVEVLDDRHNSVWREHDELRFGTHQSNLDDPVILGAEFELDQDKPENIVKRMRKAWIQRKANQPFSYEAAARMFENPRGHQAAALIEQAGLTKSKVGGATISERNANYVVAGPNATARDVLRLIDLVQSKITETYSVQLEREIVIW